jgi:hypothetical protein
MDFNAIADTLKDSFTLEILHPTTGEGGWFIELASPCHAGAQAKVAAILDRSRKRKGSTTGQDERDGIELISARILGWKGLKSGEDEMSYTPETCTSILANPKSFWLRNQLLEALGDPSRPFSA